VLQCWRVCCLLGDVRPLAYIAVLLLSLDAASACAQDIELPASLLDPVSLAASAPDSAPGAAPESPISLTYLELILADAKETATWPLRWDRNDWRNIGLVGGGLALAGALLDKPIKRWAQRGRSKGSDQFFVDVQRFGTKSYQLPVVIGFYAYGAATHDYEARATALDAFSASILASLVTSVIKGATGRARPNTGFGPGHFRPLQGDQSFPSGHATGAFAVASVIGAHYDNPWIDASAYGIASLVAVARVRLNAHWTSDVLGGAIVGGFIGHHLVDFNRRWRAENETAWMPELDTDGQQLLVTWRF
jgi:membrane-associated phospholipid phosphatase